MDELQQEFNYQSYKILSLNQALLHNQDENVGLALVKNLSKEAINTKLYQGCVKLANDRKWWNVLSELLNHARPDYDMKLIVENLVRHNQINILQKITHIALD